MFGQPDFTEVLERESILEVLASNPNDTQITGEDDEVSMDRLFLEKLMLFGIIYRMYP